MLVKAHWAKWGPWYTARDKGSKERFRILYIGKLPVMRLAELIVFKSSNAKRRFPWAPGRYFGLHVSGLVRTTYYRNRANALALLGIAENKGRK